VVCDALFKQQQDALAEELTFCNRFRETWRFILRGYLSEGVRTAGANGMRKVCKSLVVDMHSADGCGCGYISISSFRIFDDGTMLVVFDLP
jgi:hypothetical protein